MKHNYVTMTKTIDDINVKHISLLLKISFLTLFGFGVKITPDESYIWVQSQYFRRYQPGLSKNLDKPWA